MLLIIDSMLTFKNAMEMSKWVWAYRVEGYDVTPEDIKAKFGMMPLWGCGLCEYHIGGDDDRHFKISDCRACPLYWEDAKEEENSDFEDTGVLAKCSRNYWHYMHWFGELDSGRGDKNTIRNMKYWAKKMLDELNEIEYQ